MSAMHNETQVVNTTFGNKVQPVTFDRRHTSGGIKTVVKTKGLKKFVVRQLADGTCISHLPGQKNNPLAAAATEKKVFKKAVEAVWMS